ncbi:hypothetical protein [Halomonas sp. 707B3]|jgi:hypothetical protein|nr:hypothetical protein [Halomonas sp. 707B3]MCP1318524.1 hypothetical protein [Halomonas sp. 707B3]|tara:strand:+ start:6240 stop:6386 length:147 start_codon:yes stop_codon:yes gene_type:complete
MQSKYTLPAMNAATLAALVAVLAPYRQERITPAVMGLALQLARKEAMQ